MIEITFNSISLKFDGEVWWLVQPDGEAMEVSVVEIESFLKLYYQGNF